MDNLQLTERISNIFTNFFRGRSACQDYLAYKTMVYQQIYDMVSPRTCSTPEDALKITHEIIGLKLGLEQIKHQNKLAQKLKENTDEKNKIENGKIQRLIRL